MKNSAKKSLKASNGITLIALVITIIVLLILAGISISMLSGDNSILQKATDAKTNTERASIIEQAKTDILGQIAGNKGEDISKNQLKSILNTYFDENEVESLELPDNTSTSNDELTSKVGSYKIKLSEIYSGKLTNKLDMTHGLWVNSKKIGDSDNFIDYLQFEPTSDHSADVRVYLDDNRVESGAYIQGENLVVQEKAWYTDGEELWLEECYAIFNGQEIELCNYLLEYLKTLSVEDFRQYNNNFM